MKNLEFFSVPDSEDGCNIDGKHYDVGERWVKGCFHCICGPGGHHACSCMSSDHRDPRDGEEGFLTHSFPFHIQMVEHFLMFAWLLYFCDPYPGPRDSGEYSNLLVFCRNNYLPLSKNAIKL